MNKIIVKFQNQPEVIIQLDDNSVADRFFMLIKTNYKLGKPIYRDTLKYTRKYMNELTAQARQVFGWTWDEHEDMTSGIAPSLHKNLEELLLKGFSAIPAEYDHLVHELHYGLHLNQHMIDDTKRRGWLQIEWFNDSGFPLDYDFEFQHSMAFGGVRLINPFVGHGPLQLWQEQDGINITQTCKFHDFVKPGFNIAQRDYPEFTEFDQLIDFIGKHDPAFLERHGAEKIIHYTGYPVIGQVINVDDYRTALESGPLEIESLRFEQQA